MSYSNYGTPYGVSCGTKRTAAPDVSATYITSLETRIQNLSSTLAAQENAIDALEAGSGLTTEQTNAIKALKTSMDSYNTTLASYNEKAAVIEEKVEGITVSKSGETVISVNFASDVHFTENKGIEFFDRTKQTTAVDKTLVDSLALRAGAATAHTANWITRLNDIEAKTAPLTRTTINGQDAIQVTNDFVCQDIRFEDANGTVTWGAHTVGFNDFDGWSQMESDLAPVETIVDHFTYAADTLTLDLPLIVNSGLVTLYSLATVTNSSQLRFKDSDNNVTIQTTAMVASDADVTHAEAVAALFTIDSPSAGYVQLANDKTLLTSHLSATETKVTSLTFTNQSGSPQTLPYIPHTAGLPTGFTYDNATGVYTLSKPLVVNSLYYDNTSGGDFVFKGRSITFLNDADITELESLTDVMSKFELQGNSMLIHTESLAVKPDASNSFTLKAPTGGRTLLLDEPYHEYVKSAIQNTQWVDCYNLEPSHFLNDANGYGSDWVGAANDWATVFNPPSNTASFPTGHYRVGDAPLAMGGNDATDFPPGFYTVTLHAGVGPTTYQYECITRVYQCIPRIKISRLVSGTTGYESKYFKGSGYQNPAREDGATPGASEGTVTYPTSDSYDSRYMRMNACYQSITLTFSSDKPWRLEYHSEFYARIHLNYIHFAGSLSVQRHGDVREDWDDTFLTAHTIAETIEAEL